MPDSNCPESFVASVYAGRWMRSAFGFVRST
jgi:hypothetical protein